MEFTAFERLSLLWGAVGMPLTFVLPCMAYLPTFLPSHCILYSYSWVTGQVKEILYMEHFGIKKIPPLRLIPLTWMVGISGYNALECPMAPPRSTAFLTGLYEPPWSLQLGWNTLTSSSHHGSRKWAVSNSFISLKWGYTFFLPWLWLFRFSLWFPGMKVI